MSLPIAFRPEATADLTGIQRTLNNERSGLGDRFVEQLDARLALISEHPQLHAVVWRKVRATTIPQFTYVLFYRAHLDRIEVLAVVHGNRDASAWKSRV